ncbi:hypothetical protein ACFQ08_25745, partial [Streptosporangium algeriense]
IAYDGESALERLGVHDYDVLINRGLAHEAAGSADLALQDVETALGLPGADVTELEPLRDRCRRQLTGV